MGQKVKKRIKNNGTLSEKSHNMYMLQILQGYFQHYFLQNPYINCTQNWPNIFVHFAPLWHYYYWTELTQLRLVSTLILDNNKYYAATTNVCDGIETSKNGANILLHSALKSISTFLNNFSNEVAPKRSEEKKVPKKTSILAFEEIVYYY